LHTSCIWYETYHSAVVFLNPNFTQIFSGRHPWPVQQHNAVAIIICAQKGIRPRNPGDIDTQYWKLIEQCWSPVPDSRPAIGDVLQQLH
jgi:hypothetical protein